MRQSERDISNCSFLSVCHDVSCQFILSSRVFYFFLMLVWIFGFLGQELAPKFRLHLLSAFCNFSPLDPSDLIRKKKKQYLCLIVIKSMNWPSCDPHLCRLWGPSNFFKHKFNETGLADAGLNFYLQLIRREHFDISHLTPSLSVCSSNPFSGKSDSIAHSGAKMLEHFVSNVITSNSECTGETVEVRRHRAGGFLFRNNPMTWISAPIPNGELRCPPKRFLKKDFKALSWILWWS